MESCMAGFGESDEQHRNRPCIIYVWGISVASLPHPLLHDWSSCTKRTFKWPRQDAETNLNCISNRVTKYLWMYFPINFAYDINLNCSFLVINKLWAYLITSWPAFIKRVLCRQQKQESAKRIYICAAFISASLQQRCCRMYTLLFLCALVISSSWGKCNGCMLFRITLWNCGVSKFSL